MSLHKLTAGDGYTYLTRQVAAHDATDRGHTGLGEYYSEKGESPGRWWGTGLSGVDLAEGAEVTETQMRNLFGQGRHPDAEQVAEVVLAGGGTAAEADRAGRLGRPYSVYAGGSVFAREAARRFSGYNTARGLGWRTPVPADVRARIRTDLAVEMFTADHGRAPLDDRERAGWLARATSQQTTAVAGYDLTFTPVKSISTLWAVAAPEVARQIEDAHHAAVTGALRFLEDQVLFTRRGRGGVQQVKAGGLLAAMFTHRDSRSGDPNLHTHVAVANKVQDATGAWLAVDGRPLFKANVTLSETYNTLVEAEVTARLGVVFAAPGPATLAVGQHDVQYKNQDRDRDRDRGRGGDKGAVREIVGVDDRLTASWSSRSQAIEIRRGELAIRFQRDHGRPPTPVEAIALAQQANLETRQAKHEPRSETDQRAAWRREAIQVLGSPEAVEAMVAACLGPSPSSGPRDAPPIATVAREVVETVQGRRATWQTWHLRAEALRRARVHRIGLLDMAGWVGRVVEAATADHCVSFAEPDPLTAPEAGPGVLRRADGVSVYLQHHAQLYTSREVVAAEEYLVQAAQQVGGWRVSGVRVGIAVAEHAAKGTVLNAAQEGLVREFATSGRRLQVALAPAGTGKTTAMNVLARAWCRRAGRW